MGLATWEAEIMGITGSLERSNIPLQLGLGVPCMGYFQAFPPKK